MRGRLAASVGLAALVGVPFACSSGVPPTDWRCDFDASENRPLSDGDAAVGPDGTLAPVVCENTCGTPARSCTFVVLDGGVPGATCPVCTF